jgi:hypothetical protein
MQAKYSTETGEAMASQPFEVSPSRGEVFAPPPSDLSSSDANPHQIAARGFGQTFGLTPGIAALTIGLDLMLHSADIVTGGLLVPLSAGAGVVLGFITWRSQMKFYGDDDEAAKIKGCIVALLTAIPSPLPYVLFVPAGFVGWLHNLRKR